MFVYTLLYTKRYCQMKQMSIVNRKYGLSKLLHTVAFVGGGNGTHVGAAISGLKDINVRILTRKPDEWNDKLKITFPDGHIRTTKPMEMIS